MSDLLSIITTGLKIVLLIIVMIILLLICFFEFLVGKNTESIKKSKLWKLNQQNTKNSK